MIEKYEVLTKLTKSFYCEPAEINEKFEVLLGNETCKEGITIEKVLEELSPIIYNRNEEMDFIENKLSNCSKNINNSQELIEKVPFKVIEHCKRNYSWYDFNEKVSCSSNVSF